jgi:hypothetical protein
MITDGLVDTDRQTGKNRQVLNKAKKDRMQAGCLYPSIFQMKYIRYVRLYSQADFVNSI